MLSTITLHAYTLFYKEKIKFLLYFELMTKGKIAILDI